MDEQRKASLRQVIRLLAEGKYLEVESLTKGIRLSAQEMASALADYGRHLIPPPDEAFRLMSVVEIRNAYPPSWSIAMPLWTKEEGRSDLSIEVTIIGNENDFTVEVDDIHVL